MLYIYLCVCFMTFWPISSPCISFHLLNSRRCPLSLDRDLVGGQIPPSFIHHPFFNLCAVILWLNTFSLHTPRNSSTCEGENSWNSNCLRVYSKNLNLRIFYLLSNWAALNNWLLSLSLWILLLNGLSLSLLLSYSLLYYLDRVLFCWGGISIRLLIISVLFFGSNWILSLSLSLESPLSFSFSSS